MATLCFCQSLHVLETVIWIGDRVVRHDGDSADANGFEILHIANDAIEHGFDIRAVIANEHYQHPFGATNLLQAVALAIGPDKVERFGGLTEIADGRFCCHYPVLSQMLNPCVMASIRAF